MRPASSPQLRLKPNGFGHRSFVSNQTGLVATFLWSSSRENRNLLSKFSLLHLDLDHPEMCFVSWIGGPFHEQIKNEAKTNDHQFKKPNISVRILTPTKLGTNLEVQHRPTKIKNPIMDIFFPPVATFILCFWGAMEIEKVAVAISLLVVSWVKNLSNETRRGDQKPMKKTPRADSKPKKRGGKWWNRLPPLSCEEFPWVDDSLLGGSSHSESA